MTAARSLNSRTGDVEKGWNRSSGASFSDELWSVLSRAADSDLDFALVVKARGLAMASEAQVRCCM